MKTCDVSTRVQFRNVVFATDFSPAADAAIPYAAEIAKRFGAKVYPLHVRPPIVNPMTPPETWVALEEAAEAQEREWRMTLRSAFPGVETEVLIEEGPLWSTLARVIEKERIDLIVTGTRGRSGVSKMLLGSVAEEILRQAPCPVLTVGPHSAPKPAADAKLAEILFPTDFSDDSLEALPYAISLAQENQARLTVLNVLPEPKTGDLLDPKHHVDSTLRRLRDLVPPQADLWCEPKFIVGSGNTAEKILEAAKKYHADMIVLGVRPVRGPIDLTTHTNQSTAFKVVSQAACPVLSVRG